MTFEVCNCVVFSFITLTCGAVNMWAQLSLRFPPVWLGSHTLALTHWELFHFSFFFSLADTVELRRADDLYRFHKSGAVRTGTRPITLKTSAGAENTHIRICAFTFTIKWTLTGFPQWNIQISVDVCVCVQPTRKTRNFLMCPTVVCVCVWDASSLQCSLKTSVSCKGYYYDQSTENSSHRETSPLASLELL